MNRGQDQLAALRLEKSHRLAQLNKLFLRAEQRELTVDEKREKIAASDRLKELEKQIKPE